ncbi:MAG: hypothetical protein UY90_C0065G0010 [Candidatus Peregrinibacteria bacterium GW2011_GWA2_54_9]|nr:MAG: hypothetical protein UY90_C0065G0010 [Candidatus Peregrinibacteria bacterium GW2011_GWA2_54_9]
MRANALLRMITALALLVSLAGCAMRSERTCETKGEVEKCVDYFHWG